LLGADIPAGIVKVDEGVAVVYFVGGIFMSVTPVLDLVECTSRGWLRGSGFCCPRFLPGTGTGAGVLSGEIVIWWFA